LTESTVYDVWIDMTMRTTVEVDGSEGDAMEEALRLMPSNAIDAFERYGYRITKILTNVKPAIVREAV
jgi:hypothetical protein